MGIYWRARELADVFEKNEKKNKTTSVYRRRLHWKVHQRLRPCCSLHLSHKRTSGDWWLYCALDQSLLFFGQSYPLAFWLHPFALVPASITPEPCSSHSQPYVLACLTMCKGRNHRTAARAWSHTCSDRKPKQRKIREDTIIERS